MSVTRAAIVAEARSWLGTPYQHQQRAKGVAVDCVGLIVGIGRAMGMVDGSFDVRGYSRQPDGVTLLKLADLHMTRCALEEMQPGDVVVTRFDVMPCHFAILGDYRYGGLSMIHALCGRNGRGRVVEHRMDTSNLARVRAAYRLPGVA